ncbi:MAG: glycosyltransferase family 4 protein [Patescibacteria group bacterium]
MRIAILGSVALPIPPPAQGGTEWIAYHQAIGLAKRGHEITLLAARGSAENFQWSKVKVMEVGGGDVVTGSIKEQQLDPVTTESSRKLRLEIVYLSEAAEKLIELKDDYDLILNNMRGEGVFLPVAKLLNKPFVNVMHLNLFPELVNLFKIFNAHVITISNAQRKNYPDLNYLATVYNGVDINQFPFNAKPQGYLLTMGTIGRHKNQKVAIDVAKKLGMKLILAGKIRDLDYYQEIKKDIDGKQIVHLGEVDFESKVKLYQNAKAFLFPILWEEPFGLVMIEAMSCGTPVVAYNRGAISEVLINGLTGFVVENDSQMIEAVGKISSIDRMACRKRVEENFTVERMVNDYEKSLSKVI